MRPRLLKRHGLALGLVMVTVIANVVVYLAWASPSRNELMASEAQWQAERQAIGRLKTYEQAHHDIAAALARTTSREDLPKWITALAQLAKKRDLSIPSVDYQPEKFDSKDFQRIILTFSIGGPYGQVRRFLDDLERSNPFLVIEELTLARSKKERSDLDLQLRASMYLRVS